MIPRAIQFREGGRAEEELFARFRDQVSNDFTVLHHVPWLMRDRTRKTVEGEADFVIVHPDFGALVLEVKGGTLRRDVHSNLWYQTSVGKDDEHTCTDPYGQARNGARAIVEFMTGYRGRVPNWGPIGHGVCFPHGVFISEPTPAARREVLIDATHLREQAGLERRLRDVMDWYPKDMFVQGQRGAEILIKALNHEVEVELLLGVHAEGVDRVIAELSAQQYRVIRLLKHKKRLAVRGPAGSGKTLLAVERAREASRAGARTLLLCYNRPLADHLRDVTVGSADLDVCTFHQLARRLAEEASLEIPASKKAFYEGVATLALEAIDRLGGQYDAVIVDEGQVMDGDWWVPIEASLRDLEDGTLWVFWDDNQALYRRPTGLPDGMDEQPLPEAWRSSRQIFDTVMRFYVGAPVDCLGPEGPEVEVIAANGQPRKQINQVLHRLINEQQVRPSDIVVLTPRSLSQSGLVGDVGGFRLNEQPTRPNDVRISSIKRFLGLESQVVVITEVPSPSHPDYRNLMYVGLSRARALLIVVGELEEIGNRPAELIS